MTSTRPRQPWLHDLQVATHGNATALSAHGAFESGAEGLYVDDRRVVSHLSIRFGEEPSSPMASGVTGSEAHFLAAARDLGDDTPDPTVELHQRRSLVAAGLHDRVSVVSRATAPVDAVLRIAVGGDGADIATVKAGVEGGRLLAAHRSATDTVTWADDRHRTTVRFDPVPSTVVIDPDGGPTTATFDVHLGQGESVDVNIRVATERTSASAFDADSGAQAVAWDDVRVTSQDPRLARAVRGGIGDLRSLLLLDPEDSADVFAAAGTPWYLTLFGRDSIWAARMALPLGTDLALGTLRALARRQGTVVEAETAQAPGKIPHEVRRSTYVDPVSGMSLPAVYYGTIDATPLWVNLLHDSWRWGLPEDDVQGLLPHLRRAVDWLLHHASPDDSGLLRYIDTTGHGLANQGWKDSGDSMRTASGAIASAPIALVEAQAYAVEAAHGAGALLDAFGEAGGDEIRAWGDRLAGRIRERFWMDVDGRRVLAMAIDGEGALVDGVGSNMGHALGTGALRADEVDAIAAALTGRALLGPLGIATLSHDNPAYNPIGYHTGSIWTHDTAICAWGLAREGRADDAALIAATLVESAERFGYRWPELYAGETVLGQPVPYPASCRPQAWSAASAIAILTAVLGLEADAPGGRLCLEPSRTSPFGALRVEGLRFGGRPFSVAVDASGNASVEGDLDGVTVVVT